MNHTRAMRKIMAAACVATAGCLVSGCAALSGWAKPSEVYAKPNDCGSIANSTLTELCLAKVDIKNAVKLVEKSGNAFLVETLETETPNTAQNITFLHNLALLLIKDGRYDEALTTFKMASGDLPADPEHPLAASVVQNQRDLMRELGLPVRGMDLPDVDRSRLVVSPR